MKLQIFVLILGLLFSKAGFSKNISENEINNDVIFTYGDLMVKTDSVLPEKHHHIGLSAGFDSANPLQDVSHLSFSYAYQIFELFEFGLTYSVFDSKRSKLLKSVDENFGILGVNLETEQPDQSISLNINFLALKGVVNFIGLSNLPFYFVTSLSPNFKTTKQKNEYYGVIWALESRLFVKSNISLNINFNQEAEAALSSRKTVFINQLNFGGKFYF